MNKYITRKYKFEGEESIEVEAFISSLKDISKLYKDSNKESVVEITNVNPGSLELIVAVKSAVDILGYVNTEVVDGIFRTFSMLGPVLGGAVASETLTRVIRKIEGRENFTQSEVIALLEYMRVHPEFAMIASQKSFKNLRNLANTVASRKADLKLIDEDGNIVAEMNESTAHLIRAVSRVNLQENEIGENEIIEMELMIKSVDLMGNSDWKFYNTNNGVINGRAISVSIMDENLIIMVRNRRIGFMHGDKIVARIEIILSPGKTKYNLIEFINKIEV